MNEKPKQSLEVADSKDKPILLTGATGYIGGRLLSLLLANDRKVRCLTRRDTSLSQINHPNLEVLVGDISDFEFLDRCLQGVECAYYLVHSMGLDNDFEQVDRDLASKFAEAASRQRVKKIIYLGGLGNPDHELSKHLRSRQEVGDVLRHSSASIVEFRASIIIGSGSLSFEMIRSLVERLPVMICPRWVAVKAQPISVEDVLQYLLGALDLPNSGQIFEIGGPDKISYGDIMRLYAEERGLRRFLIPVPFLTPYLSSLWLGLVTPLYSRIGRKLVDSLRNPTLLSNNLAMRVFDIQPRDTRSAIQRALINEDRRFAETRWCDAFSSGGQPKTWGGIRFGSRLVDSREHLVQCNREQAFAPIRRIGGETGWYYGTWLWKIRGFLDLLFGGVGLRRGRKDPENLEVGQVLDFWRVEQYEPNRKLRLSAEMKVPGRAWLTFEVDDSENPGEVRVRQTAVFDPIGLIGLAYWYALFPIHEFVFAGMLRNICKSIKPDFQ